MGRKTLVELDEALVEQARAILGTRTIKDTANNALAAVVAGAARRRDVARLAGMHGLDLDDDSIMRSAWR